jgi:hypothetical protein
VIVKDSKQDSGQPAAKQQAEASGALAIRPFATLARRVGNGQLRSLLQAKLTVSNPTDIYEQEADRVAEQVMRMPATETIARTALQIQRACCNKCEHEDKPVGLQRSAAGTPDVPAISAELESSIAGLSDRGDPLPTPVRSFMESRFGADFGGVRVHTDAHAHGLARAVDAQAFTVGRNVVFGAGHYAPETEQGKRLLAHELTHVIQQQGAGSSVQRQPNEPLQFGPKRSTRSAGGMARSTQVSMAREQIEKQHWQLPDMERCLRTCHFASTEERRWYMQAFLKHYHRNTPDVSDQQLDYMLVLYEQRFLRSLPPDGPALVTVSAGSMAWVDQKMLAPPNVQQWAEQAAAHERWINSREYKILQRPYAQRYWQALNEVRQELGKAVGGVYATLDSDHNKLVMPPLALWVYGASKDLFAPHEQPQVFGDLAKEVATTYEHRYHAAVRHAQLLGDIVRKPSADEVFSIGYRDHLFLKEEEQQVIAERREDLKWLEAQRAEKARYMRRKWESDRYRAWVAQGEKLSAAEPFIQPFAFGALGWVVGAAYGGTQTGMLGVQTYQACVQGQGNCADAVVQVGLGIATHYATKGLNQPSAPRQPGRALPQALAPERVVTEPTANAKAPQLRPQERPTTKAANEPAPKPQDFDTEGPTHPDLFPETEKTFEMDPLPDSHIDDPGDLIENLPEIQHPPDVPPGTRPTQKPDLPPDDSPVVEPVEIEIPEKGQQTSAVRGSSRGRVLTPHTPTPAATPGRPVQQQQQQQQQRMGPGREDPTRPETPRAKQAAATNQPADKTQLGPIRKAIVYVTGKGANKKYRAIVVVGKKAYYQATGTSLSNVAGLPQYKVPGQWHHFLGIQEFTTEIEWILEVYKGAGRRGWVIKGKGISDMAPLRSLENSPLEIEFETSVPERVNEWLFNQGADSHIAVEHAGMLEPIEE